MCLVALAGGEAAYGQVVITRNPPPGSPEACLVEYTGQGLKLRDAIDNCVQDISRLSGGMTELSRQADADTAEPATCGGGALGGRDGGTPDAGKDGGTPDAGKDGGTPDAGKDGGTPDAGKDGGPADAGTKGELIGDEIVVVGYRRLTYHEKRLLYDAAAGFTLTRGKDQPEMGWTDFHAFQWWRTAAKNASAYAKQNPGPAEKEYASLLDKMSVLSTAAFFGRLERMPRHITRKDIEDLALVIRGGPPAPPFKVRNQKQMGVQDCAAAAALEEVLRECNRNGWTSPDCRRLAGCSDGQVVDPVPDGELVCGEPSIDEAALLGAAVDECRQLVDPEPGTDPCAPVADVSLDDSGGERGDPCSDPLARPTDEPCFEFTIERADRVHKVLATGIDKLGGPLIVLPDNGPPITPPYDHGAELLP
jgi:hypothetical protein